MAAEKQCPNRALNGFVLGGLTFLVGSYVAHCRFNLGPWPCQKGKRRRACKS